MSLNFKQCMRKNLSVETLPSIIKFFIFGIVFGDICCLSGRVFVYIFDGNIIATIIAIILVISLIVSNAQLFIKKIFHAYRFDVIFAFLLGAITVIWLGGIGINLLLKMSAHLFLMVPQKIYYLLFISPLLIAFVYCLLQLINCLSPQKNTEKSFFLSDKEQKLVNDDLLGFSEQAENFAERVLNQGSPDSLVFGIDAPWGIGKSTFVNFCIKFWESKHKDQVIIHKFQPLHYKDRTTLLEKFVEELTTLIDSNFFVPEIKPLLARYSKLISGAKLSFLGAELNLLRKQDTIEVTFQRLENALSNVNKKIIIVVDDLDRLALPEIKDILFALKKGFALPNISYVLCYDTDNISTLEKRGRNDEKVIEFLEKFVNVKFNLYLSSSVLIKYVSENLNEVLSGNSQSDPELVSKAIGGLKDILKSPEDYPDYIRFIGDVRKIKRLINTVLLLKIERTYSENSDIYPQDLINLLLIYINYPNIFRKIYDTETEGRRGFFSLTGPYDQGYPSSTSKTPASGLRNSTFYIDYMKSLSKNTRFLLDKVFNEKRIEEKQGGSANEHLYACYNGRSGLPDRGRNLETYLKLIVHQVKPETREQQQFYLNCKNRLVWGASIESVLSDEIFALSKGEDSHDHFWRVVTNSADELNVVQGKAVISYLLENLPAYSCIETENNITVDLRDHLIYRLLKLLDTVGWSDNNEKHFRNEDKYIAEIAYWIFGEDKYVQKGVLEMLAKAERGILGLHDLLLFRLSCSADRGGDIFNLRRALALHYNPQAPTSGEVRMLALEEMREISQKVFYYFKVQYIDQEKNIFTLIEDLTLKDLTGSFSPFVADSSEVTENACRRTKSGLLYFIVYQLGNSIIESGIGCGYYDPEGNADGNGIKTLVNDYLFNICFNPKADINNYEHFLVYLLISLGSYHAGMEIDYRPDIKEFTRVIDEERIIKYWKTHRDEIKDKDFLERDNKIVTSNYVATYKEDLPPIYKVLDELVEEKE